VGDWPIKHYLKARFRNQRSYRRRTDQKKFLEYEERVKARKEIWETMSDFGTDKENDGNSNDEGDGNSNDEGDDN
jgi:hypothetical protein